MLKYERNNKGLLSEFFIDPQAFQHYSVFLLRGGRHKRIREAVSLALSVGKWSLGMTEGSLLYSSVALLVSFRSMTTSVRELSKISRALEFPVDKARASFIFELPVVKVWILKRTTWKWSLHGFGR